MAAIGYASLPITPSLVGLQKTIKSELDAPLEKAAKKAGDTLNKGITSGVEQAKRDLKKAGDVQKNALKGVADAEADVAKAKTHTETVTKAIKAAELDLDNAREKAHDKELKAQEKLAKVKADTKSTTEDITKAERELDQVRTANESTVIKKENALTNQRQRSVSAAKDLEKAEEALKVAENKSAEAADNVTAAQARLDKANSETEKSTSKLSKSFSSMKEKMAGTAKSMEKFGQKHKLAATAALGSITALGKSAADYASEAEQSYGAAESIFEGHADKIIQASKNAAKQVGLSGREYRELSSSMGAMLKNMGMPMEEVTQKSMDLTTVAADLAATFGGTTKDAVESISSLMRGEADPIEKYGVSIKQSDINARLAAEGLDKLEGSAAKQAKAQVMLTMLTEQTASAQGQFNREVDTAAHKQQVMKASIDDLKESMGTLLLPIVSKVSDAIGGIAGVAAKHPKIIGGITAAIAGLSTAILGMAYLPGFLTKVAAGFTAISWPVAGTVAAITAAGVALGAFFTKTEIGRKSLDKLKDAFKATFDFAKEKVENFTAWFSGKWDNLTGLINEKGVAGGIFEALGGGENAHKLLVFYATIEDKISGIVDFFKNINFDGLINVWAQLQPILQRVKEILVDSLGGTLSSIWESIKNIGDTLFDLTAQLRGSFMSILESLWDALTRIWQVLEPVLLPLLKAVAGIIGGAVVGAVIILAKTLEGVAWAFEKLTAGISWLVDNVLPVLLDGLTGLVDFLANVVAVTFEFVRDIIVGSFNAMKSGWEIFSNFFTESWNGVIKPVIDIAVQVFKDFVNFVLTVVITPIYLAWEGWSKLFKASWENIIKPTIYAMAAGFVNLWTNTISPIITWIGEKFQWMSGVFTNVWQWINSNILMPMVMEFKHLWEQLGAFFSLIADKWKWMSDRLFAIWSWIRDNIIVPAIQNFKKLLENVTSVVNSIVAKWKYLKAQMIAVWNVVKNTVFAAFHSALGKLRQGFKTTVDNIKSQWDRIKAITAKPINFVIDTVYNGGIVKVWNKVADFIGNDKKLGKLKTIGGYASGGVLPGYTPGRDVYSFYSPEAGRLDLSGGEAIMRPEWVRAVGGKDSVDAMNKLAIHGGAKAVQNALGQAGQKFASGGIFSIPSMAFAKGGDIKIEEAIKRTKAAAKREHGKPYQYAGVGNPSWDCSGLWSGLYQELQNPGTMRNGRIFSTESNFGSFGFTPGLTGRVTIGVLSGRGGGAYGHMSGTIDGINIESADNPKGVQYGGSAWGSDNNYYNHQYTLADFSGKFVSGGNGGSGIGNWIREKVVSAISKILDPIGDKIPKGKGLWGSVPKALYDKVTEGFKNHVLGLAGAAGGGAGSYDGVGGISGRAESWRPMAIEAMKRNGFSTSPAQVNAMVAQIQSESGGDPGVLQQVIDVNSGGNEAKGLLQVIPSTFAAYRDPTLPNDRTDPWANMNAALRYYKARYGNDLTTMWGQGHGYASGGVIDFLNKVSTRLYDQGGVLRHGTAALNLSGKPEAILTNAQWRTIQEFGQNLWKAKTEMAGVVSNRDLGIESTRKLLNSNEKLVTAAKDLTRNTGLSSTSDERVAQAIEAFQKSVDEKKAAGAAVIDIQNSDAEDKEKALKEARTKQAEAADAMAKAEQAMWEAISKSAEDLSKSLLDSFQKMNDASFTFWNGVIDLNKAVDETRQKIAKLQMQQATDRIKSFEAIFNLKNAELDYQKVRAEGALSIAQAQKELDDARRKSVLYGLTGVNDLALAIDRFRETGVFGIDQIVSYTVERTSAVRAAEATLASVRATNILNQQKAALNAKNAQFELLKMQALQVKNAELLRIHTQKLTMQTAQLYGLDQYGATGAQRGLQGKQRRNQGIFGLLGAVVTGGLSFMTGNIAGGLAAITGGVKSIGDIIMGQQEYKANKSDVDKLMDSLPKDKKNLIMLGDILGGVAAGAGALAGTAGGYGIDAVVGGANIGSEITQVTYDAVLNDLKVKMDKIELDTARAVDLVESNYDSTISLIDMKSMAADLVASIDTSKIESIKAMADLNKAIADASTPEEVRALKALADIADTRRKEMSDLQTQILDGINASIKVAQDAADADIAKSQAGGNKAIVIDVPWDGTKSAYSAEEVEFLLKSIHNAQSEIDIRLKELEEGTKATGADYIASRRS